MHKKNFSNVVCMHLPLHTPGSFQMTQDSSQLGLTSGTEKEK